MLKSDLGIRSLKGFTCTQSPILVITAKKEYVLRRSLEY